MKEKMTRILSVTLALVLVLAMCCMTAFASDSAVSEDENYPTIELVNNKTVYKYLDDNTDPADGKGSLTAWTLPTFDDSNWKIGEGSFGSNQGELTAIYGHTPNVLLNMYMEDGKTTIPTFFFRTTFEIEDISLYNTLTVEALVDDVITVYVNGVTVYDVRDTKKTDTNMYYAGDADKDGDVTENFTVSLADIEGAFKSGENTLAVELHNNQSGSSDIYFSIESMVLSYVPPTPIVAETIVLGVGANELERRLSWYSNLENAGEVRLAKASEVVDGVFPSEYITAEATSEAATNKGDFYAKKATLAGLEAGTEYAYVIASGKNVSDICYFSTGSAGDFEFVFVGDPQLDTAEEGREWADTLTKIQGWNTHLVVSSGDHINKAYSEEEYYYFIVDEMAGIAFAPTIGPSHDSPSGDDNGKLPSYPDHFNTPNNSDKYGVNETGADYWYTYNNTLFMHLNMSDTQALGDEHRRFMTETMAANPDVKWNIVVMHTSLFSTGEHSDPNYKYYEGEIKKYRAVMAPILTELGIDVVLSGHDHIYVRSQMMNGAEVGDDVVENNKVLNPKGTLHICASSSTGSKFYDSFVDADYIACENDEYRKSAIKFSVTDTSITLESYFLDDMSVFDTFTIEKIPHSCAPTLMESKAPTCTANGKAAYYRCECGLCYEDEQGETLIENIIVWGVIPTIPHAFNNYTATAPTCTENVLETAYCEYGCGTKDEIEKEGTALGHVFSEYVFASVATCTDNAKEVAICDRGCGTKGVRDIEGTALGHIFSVYISNNNASCTEDGTKIAICTRSCGIADVIADEGTAIGHSFGKWESLGNGTHVRYCENDPSHKEIKQCVGGKATETKLAICIVCDGEYGEYKEPSDDPKPEPKPEPKPDPEPTEPCDHICHRESGFMKFVWNIVRFFIKLFGISEECGCGVKHY